MENKVLVVDNEKKMCHIISIALEMENIEVEYVFSGKDALQKLRENKFDVVISDLKMGPMDGLTLLKEVKIHFPSVEVLMMTAYASQETALEAMKIGAHDYLIKPFEMDELIIRVKRLLEQIRMKEDYATLKFDEKEKIQYKQIIGKSRSMQEVYNLVEKIKNTEATVLIKGESGTGKELIAKILHDNSTRNSKSFITVNCAAVPETLLESELFGHEKGSFTGAHKEKPGKFEMAHEGTIFLDEIGEINLETQAKLLRVLEDKTFYRVGGLKPIKVDARIIAATNRNLQQMAEESKFREDLYYRLNLFPISLPPLRERKEDIPELVWFFLNKMETGMIDKKAMQVLMEYNWPGNIRQLQNILYRASIIAENIITPSELPVEIFENLKKDDKNLLLQDSAEDVFKDEFFTLPEFFILDDFEKKLIVSAIKQANENKTKAAALLGITRRRLYSLMEKYRITL